MSFSDQNQNGKKRNDAPATEPVGAINRKLDRCQQFVGAAVRAVDALKEIVCHDLTHAAAARQLSCSRLPAETCRINYVKYLSPQDGNS